MAEFWSLQLFTKPHCDSTGFALGVSSTDIGVSTCFRDIFIQSFSWLGEPNGNFRLATFTSLDCSGTEEGQFIGTPEAECFTLLPGATPADSWVVIGF